MPFECAFEVEASTRVCHGICPGSSPKPIESVWIRFAPVLKVWFQLNDLNVISAERPHRIDGHVQKEIMTSIMVFIHLFTYAPISISTLSIHLAPSHPSISLSLSIVRSLPLSACLPSRLLVCCLSVLCLYVYLISRCLLLNYRALHRQTLWTSNYMMVTIPWLSTRIGKSEVILNSLV